MPVDRSIFNSFTEGSVPTFRCPECGQRTLFLAVTNKEPELALRLTARWKWPDYQGHPEEEFTFQSDPFQAWARCHTPGCHFLTSVHGDASTGVDHGVHDYTGEADWYTYEIFKVKGFSVAPRLISEPNGTPEPVAEEIRKAETIAWVDPSAASSRLRSAMERLMDHARVPKTFITKKGDRQRMSLRDRLLLMRPRDSSFQSAVHAIRWIGNSGTHEDVKLSDTLDAFDLVEYALDQQFNKHPMILLKKASQINKRKKPLSK